MLAVEGSDSPSLLITAKDNAAVDDLAVAVARLNM